MATFSTWCIDGGELIEVETVAATPAPYRPLAERAVACLAELLRDVPARTHALESGSALATLFADHEHTLDQRGLTPLMPGDDPLEELRQWQRTQRENVWL